MEREDNFLKLLLDENNFILINPANNRLNRMNINMILPKLTGPKDFPTVVGIDLKGSEKRKTGWALLKGKEVKTKLLKTDKEIIKITIDSRPDLISIDSPLSLPKGRDCTKDSCKCRKFGITRECERILWKRGIKVFPCLILSMQPLTERGIRLRNEFEKLGYSVIESYPGAAQDIFRIPRKKVSLVDLKDSLIEFGLTINSEDKKVTHDEIDAVTSALVGYFYLANEYEALGNEEEGYLIIPRLIRG